MFAAPAEPVPVAATPPAAGVAVAAAPAPAAAEEEALGSAAGLLPVMAPPVPVPFCSMALAWNWACVFAAEGLMLKTMPVPQWLPWRQ